MEVRSISPKEYGELFQRPTHIYNSVEFAELNRMKCDSLHYLAFSDSKTRAGMIVGERDGVLMSPFSAPFGGFDVNRGPSAGCMAEIVGALRSYAGGRRCIVTLPPSFYSPELTAKSAYAFMQAGSRTDTLLNHHFACLDPADYVLSLESKARNKLKLGLASDWTFSPISRGDIEGIRRAYRVIALNRSQKGYPLRMSFEDVVATKEVANADFFLLNIGGVDVASAQIHRTAPGIAQVIYWGDIGEASDKHPMNLLAYCVFSHYRREGVKIVDIGPSGDFDALNFGLADFKESIGCIPTLKFRFTLNP